MKFAKNYRQFNKILRKYYKKNMIKKTIINGKKHISYFMNYKNWIGYMITPLTLKMDPTISKYSKLDKNIQELFNQLNKFWGVGSSILMYDINNNMLLPNERYYIHGIAITNCNMYWFCKEFENNSNIGIMIPICKVDRIEIKKED